MTPTHESCNQPKSLSGIETLLDCIYCKQYRYRVAINLNPYQGLKPKNLPVLVARSHTVAINLNPYQGLKPIAALQPEPRISVAINLNPYQGLKQNIALFKITVLIWLQST